VIPGGGTKDKRRAKRCQPPNLGELGDLLAADAIAAQADASQAEPAALVRIVGRRCRPRHGHGGGADARGAKRCQPPNLGELGDLLAADTATGW